jgi:hypothetical protein
MATSSNKRARHLLTGCVLLLIACAAFFTPAAEFDTEARAEPAAAVAAQTPPPTPSPTPAPTPAWREPTRPNTRYVCDWKRPGTQGMAEVRFEYTRQMPQNGWLGKLHTKYPNGTTRVDLIQLFAPRPVARLGTEWSFQTTDGKIRCKLTIMRGSGEVRFGNCSNGVEQYCADQRLLDAADQLPGQDCAACRTQGVFGRVACVTRCLGRLAGIPADRGCPYGWDGETTDPRALNPSQEASSVACMTVTYWMTIQRRSGYEGDFLRERITQAGLSELLQVWRDFVNGALGPCESSHFCPGGTVCVGGTCEDWRALSN